MPCSPPLSRRASELASTTINKPTTDLKSPAPGTFVYNTCAMQRTSSENLTASALFFQC